MKSFSQQAGIQGGLGAAFPSHATFPHYAIPQGLPYHVYGYSPYSRLRLSNKLIQYLWRSPVPILWRSSSWHGDWNKSLLSIFPVWAVRKHYNQLYIWTRLQLAIPTDVPLLYCLIYSCSCDGLCSAVWRTIVTSSEPSSPSSVCPH
jgi:hypothetical protein